MLRRIRKHLSFANVVSVTALFIALGGVSYAAVKLPKNSVGPAQIKKNAVTGSKVKNSSLTGSDIKNSSLRGGDIKNSSLTGSDVKDGSLTAKDFSGSLQGTQGPQGAQGPQGGAGAAGANGDPGPNGMDGAPATRLYAAINADCASVARSSGAITAAISGATQSRCDVTFPQAVKQCVPVVTLRLGTSTGQLTAVTLTDGVLLTDQQVGVYYRDSAGTLLTTGRPPFFIAVFCP